jgi:hypothetical protein
MKLLYTTFLLLLSLNVMADSMSLSSTGDYIIINTSQPSQIAPNLDKYQQDTFVVWCPEVNPTTGEKLRAIFRVNSATFIPAINATVVYDITGASGSHQNDAIFGGLTPIGAGRSITSDESGESIISVGTHGSNGIKNQQLIFGCYGVNTGVKAPMQLTPTVLPIDRSKGYVEFQMKDNLIK